MDSFAGELTSGYVLKVHVLESQLHSEARTTFYSIINSTT